MRLIAISFLSILSVFPAVAGVRLPVVNVSAAGVSARSAFGEPVAVQNKNVQTATTNNGVSDTVRAPARNVVARVSKRAPVQAKKTVSADVGEHIVAHADVLSPRRPSSDLWAHNETPLRMPHTDEFSVIRSEKLLPDENIDAAPRVAHDTTADLKRDITKSIESIDAQIARLTEMQRRADESVRHDVQPRVATAQPVADTLRHDENTGVNISRVVVPMDNVDDGVIARAVAKTESSHLAAVRNDMTNLNPTELRKAFRKTFLSENKHLATYPNDDRFDTVSDMGTGIEGFTSRRDLSDKSGIRPLEIKIRFRNEDSALSRDNYNLLSEYAGIILINPTRAIQIAIPRTMTENTVGRKLAARRLAIVEQVLRDAGISEQRIMPVLSERSADTFVLRMISSDQYETMTQQRRNMFGDTVDKKSYRNLSW